MRRRQRTATSVLLLLIAAIAAVYGRVVGYPFIGLDDAGYVFKNPHVRTGLSWENLRWAFTHYAVSNWHPLTWVSHMADVELFHLAPGGHHFTSLAIHALNAALVFLVLRRLTGSSWRSALVAALFALHPLRVESVAWISDRKDLLCGFFFLLALWSYAAYAQRRTARRYLTTLALFALGLMAKPMIVTLPFVLLLLDYWPLGRMDAGRHDAAAARLGALVLEKVPFLALSAASSAVTVRAQQAIVALDALPFTTRVWHAFASYLHYVEKTVWPVDLAVYYPLPYASQPTPESAAAAALVVGVSLLALVTARRLPYLAVGWFWFLGTLVPVIGIVQVGEHGMADRYTYLPQIGLLLLAVWGGADLVRRFRVPRPATAAGAAGIVLALSVVTWVQVGYWRDSQTLFEHALAVTGENSTAHTVLGTELLRRGEVGEAVRHYREAVRIDPGYARAQHNLAVALARQGRLEEAIEHHAEAARLEPGNAGYQVGLGIALQQAGRVDDAIPHYQRALRLEPDDPQALAALGVARSWQGELDEAARLYRRALAVRPDDAVTHYNLGNALAAQGHLAEAVGEYRTSLRLDPRDPDTHYMLGEALRAEGETDAAIAEYTQALRLDPQNADARAALRALSGGRPPGAGG